ncbi:MAG: type II secretion system F family protein [Bacteroidia bacterium]|nr:type II secretion system F family protein [Bacteroidia bacterium]
MSINLKEIKKKQPAEASVQRGGNTIRDFMTRDIRLFGNRLNDKKKERFFNDLSILLSSGVDIKTSLELIAEEQKGKGDKLLFESIKNNVINGHSLSEAIENSKKFTPYEYYSIRIGEESGKLTDVLAELSSFFNRKIKQKRQLTNAFSYPALVLATALAAVIFMLNFIIPMFSDVFKRFGGKLPGITKFMIRFSEFFSDYTAYFLLFVVLLAIFMYLQRRQLWYRRLVSGLLLKTPVIGHIVLQIYISRFCQSMALLIASRTHLLQAVQLVKNMLGFYPFEIALEKISTDIINGKPLFLSMKEFTIFDNRLISLVRVAEEVNQLDAVFARLYKQYYDEAENKIMLINSLLEPILIIFIGLLVAVILIAMYLPMFQLSTTIY